jgi:hypothetical protein
MIINPIRGGEVNTTTLEARIEEAVEAGLEGFWAEVVKVFPEATSGDFDPMLEGVMYSSMTEFVRHWLILNSNLIPQE